MFAMVRPHVPVQGTPEGAQGTVRSACCGSLPQSLSPAPLGSRYDWPSQWVPAGVRPCYLPLCPSDPMRTAHPGPTTWQRHRLCPGCPLALELSASRPPLMSMSALPAPPCATPLDINNFTEHHRPRSLDCDRRDKNETTLESRLHTDENTNPVQSTKMTNPHPPGSEPWLLH